MFPELRKAREDKERFNRVGARVKSEADMEEIMDGLQEQEVIIFSRVARDSSICLSRGPGSPSGYDAGLTNQTSLQLCTTWL